MELELELDQIANVDSQTETTLLGGPDGEDDEDELDEENEDHEEVVAKKETPFDPTHKDYTLD